MEFDQTYIEIHRFKIAPLDFNISLSRMTKYENKLQFSNISNATFFY